MFYFTVLCSISILCWTPAAVRVVSTEPQLILPRESKTGALSVAHLIRSRHVNGLGQSANAVAVAQQWRGSRRRPLLANNVGLGLKCKRKFIRYKINY